MHVNELEFHVKLSILTEIVHRLYNRSAATRAIHSHQTFRLQVHRVANHCLSTIRVFHHVTDCVQHSAADVEGLFTGASMNHVHGSCSEHAQ